MASRSSMCSPTARPSNHQRSSRLASFSATCRDAVGLLSERHRIVVVGYFLEGRTSLELAELLDVTESRISQLRSEALQMLKDGIEAQYTASEEPAPKGRAARRRADYADRHR